MTLLYSMFGMVTEEGNRGNHLRVGKGDKEIRKGYNNQMTMKRRKIAESNYGHSSMMFWHHCYVYSILYVDSFLQKKKLHEAECEP